MFNDGFDSMKGMYNTFYSEKDLPALNLPKYYSVIFRWVNFNNTLSEASHIIQSITCCTKHRRRCCHKDI